MHRLKKIKQMRQDAAILLGGQCAVCHRKFGKGHHFHHVYYLATDKKYSDFSNWMDYQEYVIPLVTAMPDRFLILCFRHHRWIEFMKAMSEANFERLIDVARRSRFST